MPQLKIFEANGEPAVSIPPELLRDLGWNEGDCLNITKVGHALHLSKVVIE